MCEYRKINSNIPYPRVEYRTTCGLDVVILDGYEPYEYIDGKTGKLINNFKNFQQHKLAQLEQECMKCKEKIIYK